MKEIDRFEVLSPSGARRTIVTMQNYVEFQPQKGPLEILPGGTEYFTSTGVDASRNGDGTFTTFDSDETFTRL